ncbi:hypothetical protein CTAYLR_007106, partial [Chrysophaeum taylorii]
LDLARRLFVVVASAAAWVRVVEPPDGAEVSSAANETVRFSIACAADVARKGLQICAQLTNKRLSYESFTQCVTAREGGVAFELRGVAAGVWRCRAYATRGQPTSFSRRGAATAVEGDVDVAWFVVDRERWVTGLAPGTPPAALAALQRARADAGLGAQLREVAKGSNLIVASAANAPHVNLALNMVYSARRAGAPPVFVFALSETAEARLASANVATARLDSGVDLDARRDVQTKGFAAIAAMKPVAVLTVLHAGLDALWIDTDVVFFAPFPAELLEDADFAFQSGSLGPLDVARGEDHFHVEACTGVYRARRSPRVVAALEAVISELEAGVERGLDWFGDQAATNLVLFEQRFRDGPPATVSLLEPTIFPAGGLFFETDRYSPRAVLAHNNFLVGEAAKVARFERRGLWFASSQPDHVRREFSRRSDACRLASLLVGGARPQRRPLGSAADLRGNVVLAADPSLCDAASRAVAVVSLGHRPWFLPHLAPRIVHYARRAGDADVVFLGDYAACATDACAKRQKLLLATHALNIYERLLLIDDTVAIRRDAPDIFELVPPLALGATLEDVRIRASAEAQTLLALSRLAHDPDADLGVTSDASWFNSGVLVLSWLHVPLLADPPLALDPALYWDQAYVNAMRARYDVPVATLGYRYNYLGSFETANRDNAPFPARDAYFVHATTGLLMSPADRTAYLRNITRDWGDRGL